MTPPDDWIGQPGRHFDAAYRLPPGRHLEDRVRITPDSLVRRLLRAVFTGLVHLGASHYGTLPPAVDARLYAAGSRRPRRPDTNGSHGHHHDRRT